jgi:alcohol dehydrogenase
MTTDPFRFAYEHGPIRFARGAAAGLGDELAAQHLERALVVTGRTVGETPGVVDPVREGLGDRHAATFAETTPGKSLATAFDAAAAAREAGADVLVSLGGGSSLDVAKAAAVVAASDQSDERLRREFADTGTLPVPGDSGDGPLPVVAVPTTLAGADLSTGAGITLSADESPTGEAVVGGVASPRLMPAALCYDPNLFATTPTSVLSASAMNGFDKGVEALYARHATPITDGTAMRGLTLLRDALRALRDAHPDADAYDDAVAGTILVQYGVSRPDAGMLSVLHAYGHGLRDFGAHQGSAHAAIAPAALRALFDAVDGRRGLLAEALAPDANGDDAEAIVAAVTAVRDGLGLPSRLSVLDGGPERDELDAVAEAVREDSLWSNAPPGYDPSVADIEAVLREAW